MASERISRLRRVYGIALSCMIVVAGLCLAVACVGIYLSGDEPYSREAVAAAFHPISIPVYLCLVMAVGGFVISNYQPELAEYFEVDKEIVLFDSEACRSEAARRHTEAASGAGGFRWLR